MEPFLWDCLRVDTKLGECKNWIVVELVNLLIVRHGHGSARHLGSMSRPLMERHDL